MSIKNGGGLGKNECKQICCHKEWTLTYYHSFLNLSEKFFHSKAFLFLVDSVYINVEKVYQRLLQCSGRKNVLRIPYRRLKAGFSLCWLCLFVAGVLSEMHEARTFAPCKAFLFEMFAFFRRLRITLDSEQPMLKENGSFRQSEVE